MCAKPGEEPIDDEEILYRRIPISKRWYDANGLSPEAFEPRDEDTTGLSIYREKYKPLDQAGSGLARQGYHVAVFRAGDLREKGIQIVARPLVGDPGHAELPDLTCHTRDTDHAIGIKSQLSESFLRVEEGPFPRRADTEVS